MELTSPKWNQRRVAKMKYTLKTYNERRKCEINVTKIELTLQKWNRRRKNEIDIPKMELTLQK